MPQPREISAYPVDFLNIAERFETNTSPLALEQVDSKGAMYQRFRLYGFKEALKRDPALKARFGNFLGTQIGLSGTTLVVRMPEDEPGIAAIRAALSAEGRMPVLPEQAQASPEQGLLGMKPGYDGSPAENEILKFLDSPSEARLDEVRKDVGDKK
jgi:hypothetical protein